MREYRGRHGPHGGVWFGGEPSPRPGWIRGNFGLAVLETLDRKPMHGYALIQELQGVYRRPISPGLIYPTLQTLQDMEMISQQEDEGRKIYRITEKGREYLKENREAVQRIREGRQQAELIGKFDFLTDLMEIRDVIIMNADRIDTKKSQDLRDAINEAKKRVGSIIYS
ncbi:MAG: PadR family transcriptional regulator [Thermoplasmataceae archaeon]